ncbi:MAG: NAD-dependent epimerase/dehydratase family protein, partial [Candidatus Longimicrobiales bacterium M2_2A_002]
MRIFLTGGTGFIGSHVAERLRGRGHSVVALVRETSDTGQLESLGCDMVVGDVMAPAGELAGLMRGADAVVHAAAKVFESGGRDAYIRLNVAGTENVLRAAGRAAPRVVHLSSVAVYAGLSMDRPLTEDRWTDADPRRQAPYAASKHLSERAAWRLHDQGAIRLTTVRPSVVYGERDRAATPVIVGFVGRKIVPLVGGGRTTLPLVYADNVARGVVEALLRDSAIGRAYNLARDLPITGRELVDRVADALDLSPWVIP